MPDNIDNSSADDQPFGDFDSLMNGLGSGLPASDPMPAPAEPPVVPPPADVTPIPAPVPPPAAAPVPVPAVVDEFADDYDDDGDDDGDMVEPTVLNVACTPTSPLGVAAAVELGARVGLLLADSTGFGQLGTFAAGGAGESWQATYTVRNAMLNALPAGSVAMCGSLTVADDIKVDVIAVIAGGDDTADALDAAFAHADEIAAANEIDPTTSFVVAYSKDSDWTDPEIAAVVAVSLGEFAGIGFGQLDATPVADGTEMSVVYSIATPGPRDVRLLGRVVGYGGTQRFPFGEVRASTRV